MRSFYPLIAIVLLLLFSSTSGCSAAAPPAKVPALPRGGDEAARRDAYDKNRLAMHSDGLSRSWRRADGGYSFAQVQPLADSYPSSADAYHSAQARAIGLGALAGVGAGVVGFTAGYSLTAKAPNQLSTSTQVALYSAGGGAVLVALVLALVTHDPADDVEAAYNAGLRRELSLPDPKPTAPETRAVFVERTWRF